MEPIQLDARGKACPLPVIETRKVLLANAGAVVATRVDNEIAVQNLQKMASHIGFVSTVSGKNPDFTVTIDSTVAPQTPSETTAPSVPAGETIAVISSQFMGTGDEKLGAILMKGFLFALTQLDNPPDAVFFYNGGVKLSTEGSESIADLQALEAAGTEILSCGTCLDFYGLKDKLAVGGVTNLYAIAERMAGAVHLLKP